MPRAVVFVIMVAMKPSLRAQKGGVILMSLIAIAIVLTVVGLVWYAYNGGVRTSVETSPTPKLNVSN